MNNTVLDRVAAEEDLTREEMAAVIDAIMQGKWPDEEIAALLSGLHTKGETAEEVAGAALAMRKHMVRIESSRDGLLDTCGTGGDGSGTFNISTAAALVAAAAGVPVAKHGNRKITSRTGSADVLAALGVNIEAGPETVSRCVDELGIGFCFAPQLHPAMKQVAQVRRGLGTPSIFNMLGPLSNPAEAKFQLLGVGRPDLRETMAAALCLLPVERAVVVCGRDGLDEVTLAAETDVSEVRNGQVTTTTWSPADFGLEQASLEGLDADGPEESAAIIRDVLAGRAGAAGDIVVINAAAAIWTTRDGAALNVCAAEARQAIDSGAAGELLERLVEASRS
ncbi:MAG: anthranilate phosphoribosyltransferase [Pirellulaceae bacterium]|nr:anthranilate phosphoribosyltransferase [Pirellulaceae bacterium]MDP7018456.1 anthranilate phosphoribosyltransferase [Pirellulaceae bacterium]